MHDLFPGVPIQYVQPMDLSNSSTYTETDSVIFWSLVLLSTSLTNTTNHFLWQPHEGGWLLVTVLDWYLLISRRIRRIDLLIIRIIATNGMVVQQKHLVYLSICLVLLYKQYFSASKPTISNWKALNFSPLSATYFGFISGSISFGQWQGLFSSGFHLKGHGS